MKNVNQPDKESQKKQNEIINELGWLLHNTQVTVNYYIHAKKDGDKERMKIFEQLLSEKTEYISSLLDLFKRLEITTFETDCVINEMVSLVNTYTGKTYDFYRYPYYRISEILEREKHGKD